jgi:hypothetical protein
MGVERAVDTVGDDTPSADNLSEREAMFTTENRIRTLLRSTHMHRGQLYMREGVWV